MRIRKAEKLLGFTSENHTAPPPPTPWDSAAAVVAAAGLLCEINRSCCVEDLINLQSSNHRKYDLEIANDEKYETIVAGKSSDDKEEEKVDNNEEMKNGKEPTKKRREKEAKATGMMKCKKKSGEEWHYSLKELISGNVGGRTNHSKKSPAAVETSTGMSSNFYDDCYDLGIDSRESAGGGNESSDLDEESDREAFAEGFNGADHEGVDGRNVCNFNYKKKTRLLKKRGRKPVKARSLKSLLSF